MDELISILLKIGTCELDEHVAHFIASAGLIVANADQGICEDEIEKVIESLASLKIFPRQFLNEITQQNVIEIFSNSVQNILRINPGMRDDMLRYMIHIVLSDKVIAKEEIGLLYQFGGDIGFSEIGEAIQTSYVPSLDAIC